MKKDRVQLPIAMGCVIHDDAVLLIRRNEPRLPELHDKWEFPGGRIEFGETPAAACQREIREETGVAVSADEMLPFPYTKVRKYKDRNLHALVLCFKCTYLATSQLADLPKKISEVRWFPISTINPVSIQPGTLHFLIHVFRQHYSTVTFHGTRGFSNYVSLQSVDEEKNRLRKYTILIESDITNGAPFRIQCSWGRLSYVKQDSKVIAFHDADEMLRFLDDTLRERMRNGYVVVDMSSDFPRVPALSRLPVTDWTQKRQLSFFADTEDGNNEQPQ